METIDLTPNYEATVQWFAQVLADHGFERGRLTPAISLVEQAAYLAATDPAALNRALEVLKRRADARGG